MLFMNDAEYIKAKIVDEGFDYAVQNFSDGVSREDVGYHERLAAYVKARTDLAAYIGVEP